MQDLHRGWARNLRRLMAEHEVGIDPATGEVIKGISAKQLAKECGVHWTTIIRTLNGDMMLSDDKKYRVCGVLGKYFDEVFPWSPEMPPHPSTFVADAIAPSHRAEVDGRKVKPARRKAKAA